MEWTLIRQIRLTAQNLIATLLLTMLALMSLATFAATDIASTSFILEPALPDFDDPSADDPMIIGYSSVPIGSSFQLPGGDPLGEFVNDFTYPATRIGKFVFDAAAISNLFPIFGTNNGWVGTALHLTMAVTDLDTNFGDSDYNDVIFALSLSNADDGSSLIRVLSDEDGGLPIAPQFLSGFGNQLLSADPDIATNWYDLSGAPDLGVQTAKLFSESGGEIWLYLIDADDSGNNISLAKSLTADFSIIASFDLEVVVPLPPAAFLFGGAIIAMMGMTRRKA